MSQNPTLLREVRKLIIRSDYINGLGGVNGRIYRYVVEILPDPAGVTNKPLAHPMGGLPSGPQLSQEAEAWGVVPHSTASMYGNMHAVPSGGGRPTQFMPETRSFPQATPPHAGLPGMTPQMSSSFQHPMRQNQQPECNGFTQTAPPPAGKGLTQQHRTRRRLHLICARTNGQRATSLRRQHKLRGRLHPTCARINRKSATSSECLY